MSGSGFIAIYRWRVAPEVEETFRARWRDVTRLGREHGAHGSCLARDSDSGDLVAIALWPSENARTRAFERMGEIGSWPAAERLSEDRLNVLDDLWAVSPFSGA